MQDDGKRNVRDMQKTVGRKDAKTDPEGGLEEIGRNAFSRGDAGVTVFGRAVKAAAR